MEEAVAREVREGAGEKFGGGGVEGGVVFGGELGMRGGLRGEIGQAERDRLLDLSREVEIVAGDVREERVDEMQPAQVV